MRINKREYIYVVHNSRIIRRIFRKLLVKSFILYVHVSTQSANPDRRFLIIPNSKRSM
jgi:hypothetical protein